MRERRAPSMPKLALHPRTRAPLAEADPTSRQVPACWLVLLAAPVAASANGPVLILPGMADSLGIPTPTATWLVTVFAWALAVGTPLMAGLLRRSGLNSTLRLSTALIMTGTALIAVAPWLPLALAGRAAQAIGGAGLVIAAMSLAGSVRRMGLITAGFGTFGAAGPLIGSTLADLASWRMSLAVGTLALLAVPAIGRHAATRSPAPPSAQTASFDGRGAALLIATVTALVLVPRHPLPAVAGCTVTAALLAAHIRRHPVGFVPATLLRTRTFVLSALLACALATSYFALLFTVPRLLGDRTGWSAAAIGTGQLVALLAGSALSMALTAVSARMSRPRILAFLLTAAALAPCTALLTPWTPPLLLVATLAVFAASAGQATLAVWAAEAAPAAQRPTAIGLFNLCYQLGGAFGPALATLTTWGG
ncbi:MFS transporter [Streptomyces parvulus]